jgi:uncharacterized protein (TIGR02171 family)
MKIRCHAPIWKLLLSSCCLLLATATQSCAPNRQPQDPPASPHFGMIKIDAAEKSFFQGAGDSSSTTYERPCMTSRFTYDYWIDTTEVTQKEYYSVMGKRSVTESSAFGFGDNYPVYYVSWFDAILFCNRKSKAEKLDTVYSYFGPPQSGGGSVYNIAGFHINYDRDGYRLPTEAEWEFAAREGSSQIPFPGMENVTETQEYAWDAANSAGKCHPVATRKPNKFGLYDMAGNLYEWTNDLKGFYTVSAITNSIGVPQTMNSDERVIKGGAFNYGALNLRPSRRQATYPTTPSVAEEYIGFRCARGIIPNPSYITSDTSSLVTNTWNTVVTSILPLLGTNRAKLTFVNVTQGVRTLCLVNFDQTYLHPYEFKDIQNVNVPVISPNGRYVAFCSRGDGASGAASIFIRSLDSLARPPTKIPSDAAFEPRWWVDPLSLDTCIIYTNSAMDNQSTLWGSTRTFVCKIINGQASGVPQELNTDGSYHDGRSKNGRYIVTGFTQLFMKDFTDNIVHRLFVSPYNGKDANGSSQVCNVSMSPDTLHDDQCMFLDFGYAPPAISTVTGTSYGLHEYIFIARFSGTVLSSFKSPLGEASWENPEWSTIPDFAVSCARNSLDHTHAIYLVNLVDSNYNKLIEGTELSDPFLWVQPGAIIRADSLNTDSLGHYNDPPLSSNIDMLTKRMQGFWKKHVGMETVFLGSSHTSYGVDPSCFVKNNVYNMAIWGGPFYVAELLATKYLLNQCPSLKIVACDFIPASMNWTNFYDAWSIIVENKGFNYDKNHDYWQTGLPGGFEKCMAQAPCPSVSTVDTLGLDHTAKPEGWGGSAPDLSGGGLSWSIDDPQYAVNFSIIKNMAHQLYEKKIHFLLYLTPESPAFKNTNSFGKYGPNWKTADTVITKIKALQDTFPGYFHFYDAYRNGNHDYADSEASDCEHLCAAGARKLSQRLDSVVTSILNP